MNKDTLFESFYAKAEKAIKKIGKQDIKDIYAISFWKDNLEDDPRCPVITIGYNTLTQVEAAKKNASSPMEAKWNYAFWLQNEIGTIGAMTKISVNISRKPTYSIPNKSIQEPKREEKKTSLTNKTTKCSQHLWILSFRLFKNSIKEVS